MDNAPFFVGQKVVAVKDSIFGYFKKGVEYYVMDVKCCGCGNWIIYIGFYVKSVDGFMCGKCHSYISNYGEKAWHDATLFVPVQEQHEKIKYVAVSETLREKAVEIAAVETN